MYDERSVMMMKLSEGDCEKYYIAVKNVIFSRCQCHHSSSGSSICSTVSLNSATYKRRQRLDSFPIVL